MELVNEVDEVLEARIQMGFGREQHYVLKVSMVDMRIYSKQSLEYYLDNSCKILGEWNTQLAWEDFLVIELVLYPSHQEVNILACTNFQWCFNIVSIGPEVFIFGASRHGGT